MAGLVLQERARSRIGLPSRTQGPGARPPSFASASRRRMSLLDSLSRVPQASADMIDVNALIAQLSDATLLESADAYFAGLTLASEQCRKPFSNPRDAAQIT